MTACLLSLHCKPCCKFSSRNEMVKKHRKTTSQIDMTTMRIVFGSDTSAMVRYIHDFIKLTNDIVKDVLDAIQDKNREQAKAAFHLLKGPVGSSGFTRLYALCEKAEEKIMLGKWSAATTVCKDIQKSLEALESELKKL